MTEELIHISLTSIKSRLESLPNTLRSLLNQSYSKFKVHLYLSHEPYLLDEGVSNLPLDIEKLVEENREKLCIHFTKNIGPYRKLIPILWKFWGKDIVVVTADDDTIYPSHWLSTLYESYQQFHCSVAFRGHRIVTSDGRFKPYRSWMRNKIIENPSKLILPTGKDGILYNTAMFPESVLDVQVAQRLAPTADDMWFRWNLALNDVPVFVVNTDYTDAFDESDYDTSLYLNFNKDGGNDRVIESLDTHFSTQLKFNLAKSGAL